GADRGYFNIAAAAGTTNNDRPNNEFDSRSALSSFGYALTPTLQLDVIVGYIAFEGGVPGSLAFGSPTQTLDRELGFILPSLTLRPNAEWTHTLSFALAKQEDTQRGTSFSF